MEKTPYIRQDEFFDETLRCLREGKISDKLGRMFMMLAAKYANSSNFVRYTHIREELISSAYLGCVNGFRGFAPYRNNLTRDEDGQILTSTKVPWNGEEVTYDYRTCNNPFAYFTTCANSVMVQFLKTEYKESNVLNEMKADAGLDVDPGYADMIKERERKKREEAELSSAADKVPAGGIEWSK